MLELSAFEKGSEAYSQGFDIEENPYPLTEMEKYQDWRHGWHTSHQREILGEGYQAYLSGEELESNPYTGVLHLLWRLGWEDAEDTVRADSCSSHDGWEYCHICGK